MNIFLVNSLQSEQIYKCSTTANWKKYIPSSNALLSIPLRLASLTPLDPIFLCPLPRNSLLDHALERFKFALRFRRPYPPPHKNGAPNYLGLGDRAVHIVTGAWLKVFRFAGIRVSCGLSLWRIVFRDIKDECKTIIIYQHSLNWSYTLHR